MLKIYYVEVVLKIVYLINQCMTKGLYHMTPYKKYLGRKLNLLHVMVLGNIAYVHIPKEKSRQLY